MFRKVVPFLDEHGKNYLLLKFVFQKQHKGVSSFAKFHELPLLTPKPNQFYFDQCSSKKSTKTFPFVASNGFNWNCFPNDLNISRFVVVGYFIVTVFIPNIPVGKELNKA